MQGYGGVHLTVLVPVGWHWNIITEVCEYPESSFITLLPTRLNKR